jgi:hypothetical protein
VQIDIRRLGSGDDETLFAAGGLFVFVAWDFRNT